MGVQSMTLDSYERIVPPTRLEVDCVTGLLDLFQAEQQDSPLYHHHEYKEVG